MSDLNFLAVGAAVVAAFVISSTYSVVSYDSPAGDARPAPWMVGLELVRSLVVVTVLAVAADRMELAGVGGGLGLALGAWLGFPLVLLTGSILWDKVPVRRAAVHGGDWLLKLVAVSLIVVLWTG